MSQDDSSPQEVDQGIYAGIPWKLIKKAGLFFVALPAGIAASLLMRGANLTILSRLEEQPDPDELLGKVLDGLKE